MRTRITLVSIWLVLVVLLCAGMPVNAQPGQVKETILSNGLKVLTKEVHAAPVVSFMVWYKVGSRNEDFGKTGMSHLLEHMQFKGTKTLKKGQIDQLMKRNGALNNAGTWKDFTYYWETLASDKLDLAMRIESDRMVNSLIDPKEFNSEKVVVRSELEGDQNSPDTLAFYELYATAYKAHSYHWPTIGWRNDVESITRDDIYKYYKTYYVPNNATVVIVGDFKTESALAMVKKYFGSIPKGREVPKVSAVEPEQLGEKRAEIRRAGSASRVMLGWHIPALDNPDIYALDVLQLVFSSGTSSRLYKSLVDKQLATQAEAYAAYGKDPNLFVASATARDGVDIKDVESALLAEVERVKSELITDQELQKTKNQSEAQFIFQNDSVTQQAENLGEMDTMYTWRFRETYVQNIQKVTKDDVQRVARKYLTQNNRTVVTFIPTEIKPEGGSQGEGMRSSIPGGKWCGYRPTNVSAEPLTAAKGVVQAAKSPAKSNGKVKPSRIVLDNGMVVIIQENRSNPTVAIQGSVKAGGMYDPSGRNGLAEMTAALLQKGTASRTAQQIGSEKDFVGMNLQTSADAESAGFGGNSLSKNFDLMLNILSDVLRHPTFPADEVEKLRMRRLSGIRELQDDPMSMATIGFYGSVYPKGHPYYQPSISEQLAETAAITRDDILNFYKSHYGPQDMVLVVVGDVDTKQAVEQIKRYFGDWEKTGAPKVLDIPKVPAQDKIVKKVIDMPDKSQVDALVGYSASLRRSDPDYYAANLMNFILGGAGALGSRMGVEIRDNMGLAYNVYSTFNAQVGAGPWVAEVGTNPANADKAVNALVAQVKLMRDKGATQSELKDAVDFLTGFFPVRLETNGGLARVLYQAEFYGMGMDYVRDYDKIYRSVTLGQVNAAAKKYLRPDAYTLVVAGPYSEKPAQSGERNNK